MNVLTDPRIESLRDNAGDIGKLNYAIGENYFQINLLNENIDLWKQTFQQNNSTDNLLLACDKNSGDLITTKLTWVVGSAIRGANANNALEAAKLLTHMGVIDEIAKAFAQAPRRAFSSGATLAALVDPPETSVSN